MWIRERNRAGDLLSRYKEIGRYWNKDLEIDIMGLSQETREVERGNSRLFGECKFGNDLVGDTTLENLDNKIALIGSGEQTERYLFSRAGFTEYLKQQEGIDSSLHLINVANLF